jgi:hypothetical protein
MIRDPQVANRAAIPNINRGYVFKQRVVFTSTGTFYKEDYPWLRAMRITAIGAGGGSGATAATNATTRFSIGMPGGAGGVAIAWRTNIASLPSSVPVTVGAGGAAGTTPSGAGNSGGSSSFSNTYPFRVLGGGGSGGNNIINSLAPNILTGASGGGCLIDDIDQIVELFTTSQVGQTEAAWAYTSTFFYVPGSGGGYLGNRGVGRPQIFTNFALGGIGSMYTAPYSFNNYGGGGQGQGIGGVASSTAQNGFAGQPGIIILELYE